MIPPRSLRTIESAFIAAMQKAGLVVEDQIIGDGELHRVAVRGKRFGNRNGAYLLHTDGIPSGGFQNFTDALGWQRWRAHIGNSLTREERSVLISQRTAAIVARVADEAVRRAAAGERARFMWSNADSLSVSSHPYLLGKQVSAFGIRQHCDSLVVPVRDTHGHLHGLQLIDYNGRKRFTKGTAKVGHYHSLGFPPEQDDCLAIAEGYATAATVYKATGWPTAVAFDCGNLFAVAKALRLKYPHNEIVIVGDNDHASSANPGKSGAVRAALAVDGIVALPEFTSGNRGSDWNDFARTYGFSAARDALLASLEAFNVA